MEPNFQPENEMISQVESGGLSGRNGTQCQEREKFLFILIGGGLSRPALGPLRLWSTNSRFLFVPYSWQGNVFQPKRRLRTATAGNLSPCFLCKMASDTMHRPRKAKIGVSPRLGVWSGALKHTV